MGYYWDYIEQDWQPIDHSIEWTRPRARRVNRRSGLIEDLITEIEWGNNSVTGLYAGLLSRALVQTDQKLMEAHGKKVAEVSGVEGKVKGQSKSSAPPRNVIAKPSNRQT